MDKAQSADTIPILTRINSVKASQFRTMNWAAAHNMTAYVAMSYSGNIRSKPGVTKYNVYGVTGDLIGNVP